MQASWKTYRFSSLFEEKTTFLRTNCASTITLLILSAANMLLQRPLRPHTTMEMENVNVASSAAQPSFTSPGSPSASTLISVAAFAAAGAAVITTAAPAPAAAVLCCTSTPASSRSCKCQQKQSRWTYSISSNGMFPNHCVRSIGNHNGSQGTPPRQRQQGQQAQARHTCCDEAMQRSGDTAGAGMFDGRLQLGLRGAAVTRVLRSAMVSAELLSEVAPGRSKEEINEALRRNNDDVSAAAEELLLSDEPNGPSIDHTGVTHKQPHAGQWASTLRESRLREAFPAADDAVVHMALYELSDGSLVNAATALSSLTGTPAPPDLCSENGSQCSVASRSGATSVCSTYTPSSAASSNASGTDAAGYSGDDQWHSILSTKKPSHNGISGTRMPHVCGDPPRGSYSRAMALRADASREAKAKQKLIQLANNATASNDHETARQLRRRAKQADAKANDLSERAASESFSALNQKQSLRWDLHGHDPLQVEQLVHRHATAFNDAPCLLEITYVPGVGKHSEPGCTSLRERMHLNPACCTSHAAA